MIERKLGWKKDKRDERDFLHPTSKIVPDVVDLSSIIPTVRDQGNQGSCVGHGIGGILTGKAIQVKDFLQWFSPRWIYFLARLAEGSVKEDNGCEPRDALDQLLKYGCLYESDWPYPPLPSDFDSSPPPSFDYPNALKQPLLSYTRVVDGVDGICSALAAGNLVAIGSPWFSKWMNSPKNGKLPTIRCYDSLAGGHETYLYGYNKKTKYFSGSNSWGPDWGLAGRYLMPFSAIEQFKKRGGYDGHIVQVNWQPKLA